MSKSLILPAILVIISLSFLAACTRQQELSAPRVESAVPQATQSVEIDAIPKSYTLAEVSKHNTQSDCWMAVEGEVYDVTSFISEHPGGKDIVKGCGKDATKLFKGEREHEGSETQAVLRLLKIARLE